MINTLNKVGIEEMYFNVIKAIHDTSTLNAILNSKNLKTSSTVIIDSNTIIVGDFNTSVTKIDISSRWKISNKGLVLNDTLGKIDLINKDSPSKRSRLHILLKCTENILWHISHDNPQISINLRLKLYQVIFPTTTV